MVITEKLDCKSTSLGILALTSANQSLVTDLDSARVKNQSVLLIDSMENYLEHFELKRNTWFSVNNFSRIILLLRDPADTLLENFVSNMRDSPSEPDGKLFAGKTCSAVYLIILSIYGMQ